jgi:D-alanyl-lipoteichoic acid acyltransferase DltB (MBOAT superfamily)
MLFNSYVFVLAFLPITLTVFFAVGRRGSAKAAVGWLLCASLVFYGWWNPNYLALILLSVAANYWLGFLLDGAPSARRKSWLLALGVVLNLGVLGYFKYANFFVDNLNRFVGPLDLEKVVLPLAISFFTFQQIAYLVDVRRGAAREKSLLNYALFVTFFPQFIAGPIVHHSEILPQLLRRATLVPSLRHLSVGTTFFAFGLFKKVVIADELALIATPVFAAAERGVGLAMLEVWAGVLAYTLQIYFDFSGYSDMAIGLARMFGVRLPLNFDAPYKATCVIDFWRRWHMTLSRFLRDYLYIPLGGRRKGYTRRLVNLMLTMLIGGLWHGAGWTFVLWGGLHGFYLVVNQLWRRFVPPSSAPRGARRALCRAVGWTLTILAIVVAWVPFRAESLDAALLLWRSMSGEHGTLTRARGASLVEPTTLLVVVLVLFFCLVLPTTHQYLERTRPALGVRPTARDAVRWPGFVWRPTPARATLTLLVFVTSAALMQRTSEFLYFQF